MKIKRLYPMAFSCALLLAASGASLRAEDNCADVGARVKAAVQEDPATVLVVVEDALKQNENCACEIVTAAIAASKADKSEELLKQIVITALNTAESQAATIAECAVTAAPDSASAIKEAMHVALGGNGNGNGYGKAPVGKQPVPSKEVVIDEPYVGRPIEISGIYLIPPVAPAASLVREVEVVVEKEVPPEPENGDRTTTTPPPVSPPNMVAIP